MRRGTLRLAVTAALALGAGPGPAHAAAASKGPVRVDEVAITAESTEYDGAAHTYRVAGKVRIEVRDLKVTCKQALIQVTDDEEQVERIVFSGDVVAVRGKGTFRGDRVTYHVAARKLLAEGNTRTRLLLPASASAETQAGRRRQP